MNLIVVAPHFAPDVAPTGAVITRIVEELAERGHHVEVITSLPWYREHRVEPGYDGRLLRHEDTPWGRITRIHPFPTADKTDIVRRAVSFGGFSLIAAAIGARASRADGIVAMSPPLTLGLAGWAIARIKKAPFVFNVQDVFPDIAIDLGALKDPRIIAGARRLERFCYDRADAVTVLSEDLRDNVGRKMADASKVHVIPNFVDTTSIVPSEKGNRYRAEFALSGKIVVMYAGNVGLSQSLDTVIDAAAALAHEDDVVFVINGQGAARDALMTRARGLRNVRFVDLQPADRIPEVLASADVHLVPLKAGLARNSVPSKTYSILAAGRPLIASVDPGSEVAHIVERSGAGIVTTPDDAEALTKAIRSLLDTPDELDRMGRAGRRWVEGWASPAAVAESYEVLFRELAFRRGMSRN